jgi:fatty-acid desaturase
MNFSEIVQLVEIKDLLIAPGLCHFHGMREYRNNVLKTYNFSVGIKVFGINFHC